MTNIILDAPSTGGPPAVKFPTVKSSVVVGIVNVTPYRQTDMKTGEAKLDKHGNPMDGKRVVAIVVSADGAVVSGNDEPAQPGDLVSFFIEGGKYFTWDEALKEHGTVSPGDVMLWSFDHEEPPSRAGYNPRKVYVAKIRRPEAKDGDLADRCVAAYHEQAARPAVDAPSAPVSDWHAEPVGDDPAESPF